jgi:hypothetical protein
MPPAFVARDFTGAPENDGLTVDPPRSETTCAEINRRRKQALTYPSLRPDKSRVDVARLFFDAGVSEKAATVSRTVLG